MWDFLSFRRMLMPYLVQAVFWAGTALCIFHGVMILMGKAAWIAPGYNVSDDQRVVAGLAVLIGGPIILRLLCENFIVVFRINETLTDMSGGGSKGKK